MLVTHCNDLRFRQTEALALERGARSALKFYFLKILLKFCESFIKSPFFSFLSTNLSSYRASRPRSNSVPAAAGVSHSTELPSSFSHLYRDSKAASQPFTLGLATQVCVCVCRQQTSYLEFDLMSVQCHDVNDIML